MKYSKETEIKIKNYYINLYQNELGLKDWKERMQNRLDEEKSEAERLGRLQFILGKNFTPGEKCFIVGTGTAGAAVVLFEKFKCNVFGIEPEEKALDIIHSKCREIGFNPDNFKKEYCEKISFPDNEFDFIYCFTVLEHVNNVSKCIEEMIRVLKPGGIIYINTPNYWFPYEGHYKIPFPTFLPKIFGSMFLKLLNRPTVYFTKNVHYITEKQISKILNEKKDIYWFRIFQPLTRKKGVKYVFFNFLKFNLFVYPNQEIVIRKIIQD